MSSTQNPQTIEELKELKNRIEKLRLDEVKELHDLLETVVSLSKGNAVGLTTLIKTIWYVVKTDNGYRIHLALPGDVQYVEYVDTNAIDLEKFYNEMTEKILTDTRVYAKILELLDKAIEKNVFEKLSRLEAKVNELITKLSEKED